VALVEAVSVPLADTDEVAELEGVAVEERLAVRLAVPVRLPEAVEAAERLVVRLPVCVAVCEMLAVGDRLSTCEDVGVPEGDDVPVPVLDGVSVVEGVLGGVPEGVGVREAVLDGVAEVVAVALGT